MPLFKVHRIIRVQKPSQSITHVKVQVSLCSLQQLILIKHARTSGEATTGGGKGLFQTELQRKDLQAPQGVQAICLRKLRPVSAHGPRVRRYNRRFALYS